MSNDTFESATITKRANVYYDGDVTSRSLVTDDGVRKTLGIMHPGEYEFETENEEHIELYAGRLTATVDGESTEYEAGESFTVPAATTFEVSIAELVDYCCTYE
ncbi:pyrimidine/purine nucleoside phosphorylase [Natronorubrum sp. FCH18a]|uniref:pyrimidine/purine nucleoside phosphorylase n=1 Tax=Natronorubrum sp. FCH18a TaxID=3447018 RepID=UPI003F517D5D